MRGASAFETALSWETAQKEPRGLPAPIAALLDSQDELAGAQLLVALPEHKVKLEGRGRASQNDVWALLKTSAGYASMAVEGKAGEPFDRPLKEWLEDSSQGKRARLEYLCRMLGADRAPDLTLRYQLFHRTVSALIEAERFGAQTAIMIVQAFKADPLSLADYAAFCEFLGVPAAEGQLAKLDRVNGPRLYLGWVSCPAATDEIIAAVV